MLKQFHTSKEVEITCVSRRILEIRFRKLLGCRILQETAHHLATHIGLLALAAALASCACRYNTCWTFSAISSTFSV